MTYAPLRPLMVYYMTFNCPFCADFSRNILPRYMGDVDLIDIEVQPRFLSDYERNDVDLSTYESALIHLYVSAGAMTPDGKPSVPCVLILSAREKLDLYYREWIPPTGRLITPHIIDIQRQEIHNRARMATPRLIAHYTTPLDRVEMTQHEIVRKAQGMYIRGEMQRLFYDRVHQEVAAVIPRKRRATVDAHRYVMV